jgi:hypothetical protein
MLPRRCIHPLISVTDKPVLIFVHNSFESIRHSLKQDYLSSRDRFEHVLKFLSQSTLFTTSHIFFIWSKFRPPSPTFSGTCMFSRRLLTFRLPSCQNTLIHFLFHNIRVFPLLDFISLIFSERYCTYYKAAFTIAPFSYSSQHHVYEQNQSTVC